MAPLGLSLVSTSGGSALGVACGLLAAERPLRGSWASVAVVHGLSCSEARGIFLDQGLNLCPLHQQADF